MSEPTEREWLEGLRHEDKFPDETPEHERCACWWHEDRRIGWTEDDFCPQHPDDHVPEQQVWES